MGPRNRRRLTTSSVALTAAIALTGFALWFFGASPFLHSSNQSSSSSTAHAFTLIPNEAGLPYGMTKLQMIHRLGKPEKVAGQCWQYPENQVTADLRTINAVRMCFSAGQYQTWFIEIDGIWNTAGLFDERISAGNAVGPIEQISPPTTVTASPLDKKTPDWSKRPHASSR